MLTKVCKSCKKAKVLNQFFTAPFNGAAHWHGTSMYCKQCHDEGKVKNGYGSHGEKYRTPDSTR